MKESLKANGWALNTEYFGEIIHMLRDELVYRAVVDELLELPKNAATRDTEAIKRICTGFLKLIFPNVTDVSKLTDINEFILLGARLGDAPCNKAAAGNYRLWRIWSINDSKH